MTGIGGQGVQLVAKSLALAATLEHRYAQQATSIDGSMRGGQSIATVVVGDAPLRALPMVVNAASAIGLHEKYWPQVGARLRPRADILLNSSVFVDAPEGDFGNVWMVPATDLALETGNEMAAGLVLLGAFTAITGLVRFESLGQAIRDLLPPYRQQHVEANERALQAGAQAAPAGAAPVQFHVDAVAG